MREGDACVRGAWCPWSVVVIAAANMDVCIIVYVYIYNLLGSQPFM